MRPESAGTCADANWMRQALAAAHEAERGEVPVGTCIVSGDKLFQLPETERAPIGIRLLTRKSSRCAKPRRSSATTG